MTHPLSAVIVEPPVTPNASVIWLHGLGANGHDFEAIVPELNLPKEAAIRFIFPHSPSIPVTINGGMVMPAWYDILEMGAGRKLNTEQLLDSASSVARLVDHEVASGIRSERIILAGFSQGGAVAYQVALTYPQPLAGLLALSTYFPTAEEIQLSSANKQLDIEVMHGSYDPVVLTSMGKQAVAALTAYGFAPHWREYPMEHQVCYPQIKDISNWLQEKLL
ncbi:carboxylesterase [Photobacterium gaetbulicola]|uniref:Phospholipase/carboxylesterase family protein n=1 Tax=Photobacterium gaetbulicola Gung47 TaxID=658445 RepID=A0A0C5WLJ4_9GAMM|nr:alpha/beta fold hydrolase [Photobacterium gaetbulicola]AJR05959.1 phospholipase/carboxylesterase family protein [Photobacterium gaetbulicola Gung47]PSU13232.1 carboxylesterase [Photobacterium gaetbulicola]